MQIEQPAAQTVSYINTGSCKKTWPSSVRTVPFGLIGCAFIGCLSQWAEEKMDNSNMLGFFARPCIFVLIAKCHEGEREMMIRPPKTAERNAGQNS